MSENLLTISEVARTLGFNIMTLYRWVKQGRLSVVRIGNRIRVPQSELDRLTGNHIPAKAETT